MSGSYIDAAGPTIDADMAATEAAVSSALANVRQAQAQSVAFVADYGAAAVDGHAPVGDVPPALGSA